VSSSASRPLIVGSGIAGLYVALRCQEVGLRPTLVTKSTLEESNTRYAQGGIAAAIGPDDSPALHLKDTLRAGAGLVDRAAARILVEEAPRRIADLVRFGVPFDTIEGQVALGREAAHSRARILHAGGDATGLQIEETLKQRAIAAGVETRERTSLRGLLPSPSAGVVALLAREGERGGERVTGGPVVLATGGAGNLYRESSNPAVARGEGVALAARAGALVTDMEFMQFHPTVFHRGGAPRFLLTEAIRGEGALLRNDAGERFMPRYHPDAELAPRDVVTRAIHSEMERRRAPCVYLDATAIPRDRLLARFPTICRFLSGYALDLSRDWIPVTPAAHFMIGGVTTDHEGRTTLGGLLACGEVAATSVHGANRLASNSLLEGLVFGERVVRQLLHPVAGGPLIPPRPLFLVVPPGDGGHPPPEGPRLLQETLWEEVGIVRAGTGLRRAVRRLGQLLARVGPSGPEEPSSPFALSTLTALLIARAALNREESRGTHYRSDFPKSRANWRRHQGEYVRRSARSRMQA
jgi:L-aspartate oxidase